jgi:hypothetical protein
VIKSGTINLPSPDPMTGTGGTWDLNTGTGTRSYVSPDIPLVTQWGAAHVPFGGPPVVVLSLAGMEATGGLTRVRVQPENVQAEEFNIRVYVFDDCTLNWLWVTWLAYDEV